MPWFRGLAGVGHRLNAESIHHKIGNFPLVACGNIRIRRCRRCRREAGHGYRASSAAIFTARKFTKCISGTCSA